MSDEVPSGRLSQIFDPLTNLQQPSSTQQQQQQQHHNHQHQQPHFHLHQQLPISRRRSNSSSPSPSTSGRATPASLGATSVGSGGSSSSSHHQHQQPFSQNQQNYQYLTQTQNYFLRPQDGNGGVGGAVHNYLHTFPSAASQSHYFHQQYQQQQQHQYQQQYPGHQQPPHLMSSYMQHTQQQQHSLPPLYATSHSLNSSPLLTKRAISFSGNMPLSRQQMENVTSSGSSPAGALQRTQATAQSTPNSPRLMPRRPQKPPPIPAKPTGSGANNPSGTNQNATLKDQSQVNPASSLDGADAPWPHFSALTEYLDVHQVNNYSQGVPEVKQMDEGGLIDANV